MITISDTLEAQTTARSRAPLVKATVEDIALDFSYIPGLTVPLGVHRLVYSSSGYWFATGYIIPGRTTIYYKVMSGVTEVADWSAGWNNLDNVSDGYIHDVAVDGDNILVAYQDPVTKDLATMISTDGGSSWSGVNVQSVTGDLLLVSTPDIYTIFTVSRYSSGSFNHTTLQAFYRSNPNLNSFGTNGGLWLCHFQYDFEYSSDLWSRQFYSLAYDNIDEYFLMYNSSKGQGSDKWRSTFTQKYRRRSTIFNYSYGVPHGAVGGMATIGDYRYEIRGVSKWLNGYAFAGVTEIYGEKADPDGLTDEHSFFIGRTVDGKAYNLIPANVVANGEVGGGAEQYQYIAGAVLAENGTQICVPVVRTDQVGRIYLCSASSWWGETPVEADVTEHLIERISISQAVRTSAKTTLQLTNKDEDYNDHATVKPGSLLRVDAGYVTAAGEEYQQRFAGLLQDRQRTTAADKVASFNVLDLMARTTSAQEHRPHILRGHNIFFTDFEEATDIDMFVAQGGAWQVVNNRLEQATAGIHAYAICGYEPDDAWTITGKFRWTSNESTIRFGFVLHDANSGYPSICVSYWKSDQDIHIGRLIIDTEDITYQDITHAGISLSWLWNNDYWLMVTCENGCISIYYSSDGLVWVDSGLNMTTTHVGNESYPAVYTYRADGSVARIFADDIRVFSGYPPLSGSDVMDYMARACGMDTAEVPVIDDTFPGAAFASGWNSLQGGWSVSGGSALGYTGSANPALIRNSMSVSDVVLHCYIALEANGSGLMIRATPVFADCYVGLISTTKAIIKKASAGAWSTLCEMPLRENLSVGEVVKVTFCGRGGYLSLFVDNYLAAHAYDDSFEEGYIGMATLAVVGDPGDFNRFIMPGFYKPTDVVAIRPKDTMASVMSQVADMYEDGNYYCDANGNLAYGIYDDTSSDLDVTSDSGRQVSLDTMYDTSKVYTIVRVEGTNAYGEARSNSWAIVIGRHRYEQVTNKFCRTGIQCYDAAVGILEESQKVTLESVVLKGHPGLELGDIVTTSEYGSATERDRRVLAFSETIGAGSYEQALTDLLPLSPVTVTP